MNASDAPMVLTQAFRGLEEKGLVRTRRDCGVQVRSLSLDEADQVCERRIALEEMIGRKVAERRDADSLHRLAAVMAEMQRALACTDIGRYVRLNVAFHDELARGSGNAELAGSLLRRHACGSRARLHQAPEPEQGCGPTGVNDAA